MRTFILGAVIGAALLGAGLIGHESAQADPLILDCNQFVSRCGSNPIVNDPPLTGWDDPRIALPSPAGDPSPVLDFGLIVAPGATFPAPRGDMQNGLCDGRPCY